MLASHLPEGDISVDERTDLSASIQSALRTLGTALALLSNGRVIVPFLICFIIKTGIIFFYVNVISEPFISFWALFIRGVSGSNLAHYPQHLIMMQKVMSRFDIFLEIFLDPVFQGAAIFIIASVFRRRNFTIRQGLARAGGKYIHLIITAVIASGLILTSIYLSDLILGQPGGLASLISPAAGSILGLVIQAFLLYAFPLIILRAQSAWEGMYKSFNLSRIFLVRSVILVTIPFILTLPVIFLEFNAHILALRLSPEVIIYLQIAKEVIQVISDYLLFGGATIMFIRLAGKLERDEQDSRREE